MYEYAPPPPPNYRSSYGPGGVPSCLYLQQNKLSTSLFLFMSQYFIGFSSLDITPNPKWFSSVTWHLCEKERIQILNGITE